MTNTKKPDEIWADFDSVIGMESTGKAVPEGALFSSDIEKRFNCSNSTALLKMRQAIKGGWKQGFTIRNGCRTRYIYK